MDDKQTYIRDRLIIAAPVLAPYLLTAIVVVIWHVPFIGQMLSLAAASLAVAGLSFLPTVREARMRLLRRRYPPEK